MSNPDGARDEHRDDRDVRDDGDRDAGLSSWDKLSVRV